MAVYTLNNVQMTLNTDDKTILVVADIQRDAAVFRSISITIEATRSVEVLVKQVRSVARRVVEVERIKRQGIAKAIAQLEGLEL